MNEINEKLMKLINEINETFSTGRDKRTTDWRSVDKEREARDFLISITSK